MNQHTPFDYIPPEQEQESEAVLFENTHMRDKSFWREFLTYSNFKRPPSVACYTIMAFVFIYSLIQTLTSDETFLFGLVFPPLFCLLMLVFTLTGIKTALKREQENGNGAQITYLTRISDAKICLETSLGTNYEIAFTTVKRVVQTKNYLMLQTPTKQCYPLKKDGFTKGSYEELCAFLRAKGYKVKTK